MKPRFDDHTEDKLDKTLITLGALVAGGYLLSRFLNYHPRPVETLRAHNCGGAPVMSPGQAIKVITYNAQFFAGTRYNFFYDGGPDTLVDPDDVHSTISQFAKFVAEERPDSFYYKRWIPAPAGLLTWMKLACCEMLSLSICGTMLPPIIGGRDLYRIPRSGDRPALNS
jgi:hypothetical protein